MSRRTAASGDRLALGAGAQASRMEKAKGDSLASLLWRYQKNADQTSSNCVLLQSLPETDEFRRPTLHLRCTSTSPHRLRHHLGAPDRQGIPQPK